MSTAMTLPLVMQQWLGMLMIPAMTLHLVMRQWLGMLIDHSDGLASGHAPDCIRWQGSRAQLVRT